MALNKALLFVVLLLGLSTTVYADPASEIELDRKSHQVFDNIMSPFCPGKTLNDCPSSEAAKLKAALRNKLSNGSEPNQLIDELVNQYGDELRAAPENAGFGRLAWLGPIIFLVVGLFAVVVWLVRSRKAGAAED